MGNINNNFIFDEYNVSFTYTLDESNTFLSASLLSMSAGTVIEISSSADGDGSTTNNGLDYTTTFYIDRNNNGYAGGVASGSQKFTASVHVTLQDESKQSYNATSDLTEILDKNPPADPGVNVTYDFLDSGSGGTPFISNAGSTATSPTKIERGATGSIQWYATANATSNGWSKTSVNPTAASPTTTTYTTIAGTDLGNFEANWNSNSQGNPSSIQTTRTKNITRIESLRYAALPSGYFSDDSAPTDTELFDLYKWATHPGAESNIIRFNQGQTNDSSINNTTIDIDFTGTKNMVIVYDKDRSALTQLLSGPLDILTDFTTGTTTYYRYYILPNQVADPSGTTYNFTLKI